MPNDQQKTKNDFEYFIAGGTAGMISRTCIAPIERVKIMYQVSRADATIPKGYRWILPNIVKNEGVLALWKGNSAAVARVVPYMSIQFLMYEKYGAWLKDQGVFLHSPYPKASVLLAGSLAGMTAVCTTYPLDVVRARLAMQSYGKTTTNYKGFLDALRRIPKEEGFMTCYRGMGATLVGVAPYTGLKFLTYETGKQFFSTYLGVEERDLAPSIRIVAGSVAGAIALTFVYPFDVIRRRMQTHRGGKAYPSVRAAIMTIWREEGVRRGLYKGLSLNYIKTLPNVALYMSVYDFIKYTLT